MEEKGKDLYTAAHLFVAAIRVCEHQMSSPPTIDDISKTLAMSLERSNYVCRKKASDIIMAEENGSVIISDGYLRDDSMSSLEREQIGQILEWLKITKYGDKSELSFVPYCTAWDLFSSEADTCLKSRCKSYASCFYQKTRKEIFTSQLLVINHHILCADLSIKLQVGGV